VRFIFLLRRLHVCFNFFEPPVILEGITQSLASFKRQLKTCLLSSSFCTLVFPSVILAVFINLGHFKKHALVILILTIKIQILLAAVLRGSSRTMAHVEPPMRVRMDRNTRDAAITLSHKHV
jgi:hypothetical protein